MVNCGWNENYFARNGGELSSPGFPNFNYPNNMDCTTLIYVDHGFQAVVDITFFSLENNFDFLTIYAEENEYTVLFNGTGRLENIPTITADFIPAVRVHFTSDGSATDIGFHLTFAQYGDQTTFPTYDYTTDILLGDCAWNQFYDATVGGELSSPGYPNSNYPNNLDCQAYIFAEASQVKITILNFTLEEDYDFLTIYDGDGSLLFRRSGTLEDLPFPVFSRLSQVSVHFTSDYSFSRSGFTLSFERVDGVTSALQDGSNEEESSVKKRSAPKEEKSEDSKKEKKTHKVNPLIEEILLKREQEVTSPTLVAPTQNLSCSHPLAVQCESGDECVYPQELCDGVSNCRDGSDEHFCGACGRGQLHCGDGNCVDPSEFCNGLEDCLNGADEAFCECVGDNWYCRSRGVCLPNHFECDGFDDCNDPYDEPDSCNPRCTDDQFQCNDLACIDGALQCDGYNNCKDGSDEWICLVNVVDDVVAYPPGMHSDDAHQVCSSSDTFLNDQIASRMCSEVGSSSQGYSYTLGSYTGDVMEVADPLPQDSSIRRGATFYNGQCVSGQIFETLVCRPAECGVQSVDPEASSRTFIVNGKDAQNGAWPWQISLQVRDFHFCGGSILNRNWVLTAAHCMEGNGLYPIEVVAGDVHKDEGVRRGMRRFIMHPEYRFDVRQDIFWSFFNDIALIQLDRPLIFSETIQPACLPSPHQDENSYSRCYITGWGSYDGGDNAPVILQQGKTKITPMNECRDYFTQRYNDLFPYKLPFVAPVDHKNHVCVGDLVHPDAIACYGDSGGPMTCQDSEDGKWYQRGVTSFTPFGNCQRGSVYMNTQNFVEWIDSVQQQYDGMPEPTR